MELNKIKAEKEESERLEKLEQELAERRIQEEIITRENILRIHQLIESGEIIKDYDKSLQHAEDSREIFDKEILMECRSFPDLAKLNDVNSFYVDWVNQIQRGLVSLENVLQKSPTILQLIDEMLEFLKLPPDVASTESLQEMGFIYHSFCETQQKFIDQGTYYIMTDLTNLFDPELGVFENSLSTKEIVHSLWGNLYSCPEYRGHFFESLNFRFRLPDSLILIKGIYRLLKTEYDHFSNTSHTYYPPNVKNFHRLSIQTWLKQEPREQLVRDESKVELKLKSKIDLKREKDLMIKKQAESETIKQKWSEVKSDEKPKATSLADLLPQEAMDRVTEGWKEKSEKSSASSKKDDMSSTVIDNQEQIFKGNGETCKVNELNGEENVEIIKDHEKLTDDVKLEPQVVQTTQDTEQLDKNAAGDGTEGESKQDRNLRSAKKSAVTSGKQKGKKVKGKVNIADEDRPKTEAELAKDRERKEKTNFLPHLIHPNELNLRNYVILAGIYNFKLYEIPPQPKPRGKNSWTLHQIEPEQSLKEIEFLADYIPPPLVDLGTIKKTPEEMEREAKKQEEELQKLVQLEIKVPKIALWFDPPTPVRWESELKVWSTDGFYDIRFREDSLQMSFRTTKFGIIGLAHNRWSNLPYQSWEIRPTGGPNSVIFILTAAMAVVEFTIKNDSVCVSSLQNVSNSDEVENALLQKFMTPRQLIKALRSFGLDVFPEFDSYAYVDGVLVKHVEAEDHMYHCMAIGAPSFNFHWSRWNLLAGREKMIYQIRERLGTTTPGNYQMVLNTPRSATLINCTEVSPTYSEEKMEHYEYCADLLQLINRVSTEEAKDVIKATNGNFIETLRTLLSAVRPLSFS